mmetsp:Transcript_40806/g.29444  ORF Transcript_40806/g.29444 Transcript_40806/m.29444 type:complete len:199 (+) Transcript_40806:2-598(+)
MAPFTAYSPAGLFAMQGRPFDLHRPRKRPSGQKKKAPAPAPMREIFPFIGHVATNHRGTKRDIFSSSPRSSKKNTARKPAAANRKIPVKGFVAETTESNLSSEHHQLFEQCSNVQAELDEMIASEDDSSFTGDDDDDALNLSGLETCASSPNSEDSFLDLDGIECVLGVAAEEYCATSASFLNDHVGLHTSTCEFSGV